MYFHIPLLFGSNLNIFQNVDYGKLHVIFKDR